MRPTVVRDCTLMTDKDDTKPNRLIHIAFIAAWLAGIALCWVGESNRIANTPDDQPTWVTAITNLDADTSLFTPLLLLAPAVWFSSIKSTARPTKPEPCSFAKSLAIAAVIAVIGFGASQRIASTEVASSGFRFDELPPAYHDEFSYLFQANTFLAGRTAFPTQGPDGLFDQMHVLNDRGSFASRYFPSTGLWIMPAVAVGKPWLAHQVANGLIAGLFCFAACRISGSLAGVITGGLIAFAPGMAIFSNMLLAHHPTLVGLGLFTVAFLEARTGSKLWWGLLAGAGLTFAMLARPMSAAGFALPFGIWLLLELFRNKEQRAEYNKVATGLAIPILCGFFLLAVYNRSITSEFFRTPYSLYTERYTPKHVYGFNNAERGSKVNAPKRIAKYDDWAVNLTPTVAWQNATTRIFASFRWTLGLVPNAFLAVFSFVYWPRLRGESRVTLMAILSLHLAHIPYWFDGIMHYHYIFETNVLWCLLAGLLVTDLKPYVSRTRPASAFVACCVAAMLTGTWLNLPNPMVEEASLFRSTKIQQELDGIAFSKLRYQRFKDRIAELPTPNLILVEHDPADIHIEYVNNTPQLDSLSLTGHYLTDFEPDDFPGRHIFVYSARSDTLSPWKPNQ